MRDQIQMAAAMADGRLGGSMDAMIPLAALFDHIPDIVFFVKNRESRYVAVNQTLVSRCKLLDKASAIGKTSAELFPSSLSDVFHQQDRRVLSTGVGFHDRLELHLYADGRTGWCVSYKTPVLDADGRVVGLCGISRDLQSPGEAGRDFAGLSLALEHIHQHFDEPLRLGELAAMAGLSVYQLNERIRGLFHVTAGQYLVKLRIDAGCRLLAMSSEPIVEIALSCGYSDQSSFTRQFKQVVGITPKEYRRRAWSRQTRTFRRS